MEKKHQFKMNIPDDVMIWVREEAEKNCRSKSAQIIFALRVFASAGEAHLETAP